jgi:anti-anti-sigma factor
MAMMEFLKRRRSPPVLSPHASQWLDDVQRRASETRAEELVVDLSSIEWIDSRQLGELVKIHLDLRRHDRRLVLDNAHGGVLEILELTRMNRLLEVRETLVGG